MDCPNPPAIVVKADQGTAPILVRNGNQWNVVYKGRSFSYISESEAAARVTMNAIVANVDNSAPLQMAAPPDARPAPSFAESLMTPSCANGQCQPQPLSQFSRYGRRR